MEPATGNTLDEEKLQNCEKSIFLFETRTSWKCKYQDPTTDASSSLTVGVTCGPGISLKFVPEDSTMQYFLVIADD